MVAYLKKSTKNAAFDEIVDFLNTSPIRYALTISPTIYVSCIQQFWSNTKIKTVNNEIQIHAKVDGKTIVISESSVRRDLQFNDEDGIACLINTEIFENLQLMGYENLSDRLTFYKSYFSPIWKYLIIPSCNMRLSMRRGEAEWKRATTTASSLKVEQNSSNILRTQSMATLNEPIPQGTGSGSGPRVNTIGSGEDNMKLNELMEICIKLFEMFLDLEKIKHAQALDIQKLKTRVKKLERKKKSRTPQLKRRLFKVRIESSAEKSLEAQGMYGDDIEVTTASAPITTAGVSVSTVEPNYELAIRLQAEEQGELTIEERSRLLMELMDERKRHFARLRAEEKRRKPPIKA
ncbi:hypothetical protein Tco_0699434 [Tanacetum coccineum]